MLAIKRVRTCFNPTLIRATSATATLRGASRRMATRFNPTLIRATSATNEFAQWLIEIPNSFNPTLIRATSATYGNLIVHLKPNTFQSHADSSYLSYFTDFVLPRWNQKFQSHADSSYLSYSSLRECLRRYKWSFNPTLIRATSATTEAPANRTPWFGFQSHAD